MAFIAEAERIADGVDRHPSGKHTFCFFHFLIQNILVVEEYDLSERNFALGFRALSDGTEYWYNADKLFETASLYKLPLNMYFYELEAAGELEPHDL